MSGLRATGAAAVLCLYPGLALAAGDGDGDFGWRVANLVLLLALLFVAARKPIQSFFSERHDRIRGDVEQAARAYTEAEQRYARLQRQVADLDAELDGIRRTARERAEAERARILEDARATAERIHADARVAIDQELRRARDELRREASHLAVELAADLLRGEVRDDDRERLVDEFIERVESAPNGGTR